MHVKHSLCVGCWQMLMGNPWAFWSHGDTCVLQICTRVCNCTALGETDRKAETSGSLLYQNPVLSPIWVSGHPGVLSHLELFQVSLWHPRLRVCMQTFNASCPTFISVIKKKNTLMKSNLGEKGFFSFQNCGFRSIAVK